ncbi:MAG: Gldg family protein [Eubacteriales bacterium]
MKRNRKIKYTIYSSIILLGLIAVILLANLFVSALDSNFNLSLDMTAHRLYSLTSTSKDILGRLETDIFIYTTETAGIEDANIQELLKNYSAETSKIHVVNIDIVQNPGAVEHYNEFSNTEVSAGSIIISNSYDTNDRTQIYRVLDYGQLYLYDSESESYDGFSAEDAITGAIKYVISPKNQKIWILDNHISDNQAIESIKEILINENYQVGMLNLLNGQSEMQSDDIVLIISPDSDITPIERDILDEFMDDGGKMILAIDPSIYASNDLSNVVSLAQRYNIGFGKGIIKETDLGNIAVTGDSDYMYSFIIADMNENEITNDFILGDYKMLLGMNAGRLILPEKINDTDITIETLLYTSDTSYIEPWSSEMDDKPDVFAEYGEFPVMALASDAENDSKLMVLSSPALFTYAQAFSQNVYRNKDFMLKCVAYLADEEQDFYISSKPLAEAPLMIATMNQAYFIIGIVCVAIPLLIFGIGIFIFIKRKNL